MEFRKSTKTLCIGGQCSHCRCNCCAPILSYWFVLFSWWWFCGRFFC